MRASRPAATPLPRVAPPPLGPRERRGRCGACRAPAWGGRGRGRAGGKGESEDGADPRVLVRRALCAAAGPSDPWWWWEVEGSSLPAPRCNDCVAPSPPAQDVFTMGSDCGCVVGGTARRPSCPPGLLRPLEPHGGMEPEERRVPLGLLLQPRRRRRRGGRGGGSGGRALGLGSALLRHPALLRAAAVRRAHRLDRVGSRT